MIDNKYKGMVCAYTYMQIFRVNLGRSIFPTLMRMGVVVACRDVAVSPRGLDYRFPARPVVYVFGNHEFYRHNLPRLTHLKSPNEMSSVRAVVTP